MNSILGETRAPKKGLLYVSQKSTGVADYLSPRNFFLTPLATFLKKSHFTPYMKNLGLRSPFNEVAGLVYFGRMVDQIRTHARGELPPDYKANLGKGLDEYCANFLGVTYSQLVQYVNEGLSDEAVLESCFAMGHRPSEAEIYMWNEFMLKRGWHDDASRTLKQLKREEALIARSEIETIFQLIDAAEGRPPHPNHHNGSSLDELSLVVGGRRH